MSNSKAKRRFSGVIGLAALLSGASATQAVTVTLFHNNDGESKLLPAANGSGGAANYVGLLNNLRANATTDTTLTLSSGDNFLAGTAFNASIKDGIFYDAVVLNAIQYDAIALGNHDFDFGPQTLANFINSSAWTDTTPPPYLSANLDFTGEAGLQALVDSGRIAASTIVEKQVGAVTERFGIIGAVTPTIASVSSPGNVVISDVLSSVQAEVNALQAAGVNKIILISHLQAIAEELALVPQLRGVDVVIAGGGDNLLADAGVPLLPGDVRESDYPRSAVDADGNTVFVVTTSGEYKYIGKLELDFNADGQASLLNGGGNPVRVLGSDLAAAGIAPDAFVQANAVDPVKASIDGLALNVLTQSDVPLDGIRNNVRSKETNLGNLITDALLFKANEVAPQFGLAPATVAIQNGGGIRNNSILPAGNLTELTTLEVLPFFNFVAMVEDVTPVELKRILEHAVSRVEFFDGRFAQVSGLEFSYNLSGLPMITDSFGVVTQEGQRIFNVMLEDGTWIVQGGQVVAGAPNVNLATIDFLAFRTGANGTFGDNYPFAGLDATRLGVTYQQALADYLVHLEQTQGGVSASQYAAGTTNRIAIYVPEPATMSLLGLAGMLLARRNRRIA